MDEFFLYRNDCVNVDGMYIKILISGTKSLSYTKIIELKYGVRFLHKSTWNIS